MLLHEPPPGHRITASTRRFWGTDDAATSQHIEIASIFGCLQQVHTVLATLEKRPPDLACLACFGSALLAAIPAFFCTDLAADFTFCESGTGRFVRGRASSSDPRMCLAAAVHYWSDTSDAPDEALSAVLRRLHVNSY